MKRDLHNKPFDSGTNAKLSIFHDYLKEWLPVFLAKKETYWHTINIFDFFSGPGIDVEGVKGTPLLILDELEDYLDAIESKKLKINLYFNDYSSTKIEKLKELLISYENQFVSITIESKDFKEAFRGQLSLMSKKDTANLLFLDQTGIKQIDENIFKSIIDLKTTDFLFFISSSTIKRFKNHPAISNYHNINPDKIESTEYDQIHRLVTDYYRELIPKNKSYYIAPFSLKKRSGLYGLIFGSGNPFGIEKFLRTCWKIDPIRGEANFDIDNDKIQEGQIDLFSGAVQKPKKIEKFESELTQQILSKLITNDRELYLFTLNSGFIPSHSRKVIRELIKNDKILKTNLNISYKVFRKNAVITKIEIK
jgi:three-Cys-motif partner protein